MQNETETQTTPETQGGVQFKVVKRYKNRKLYDTETSQYVTLTEIQDFVKAGRQVIVLDNVSKRDITTATLRASLLEVETEDGGLSLDETIALIKRVSRK